MTAAETGQGLASQAVWLPTTPNGQIWLRHLGPLTVGGMGGGSQRNLYEERGFEVGLEGALGLLGRGMESVGGRHCQKRRQQSSMWRLEGQDVRGMVMVPTADMKEVCCGGSLKNNI